MKRFSGLLHKRGGGVQDGIASTAGDVEAPESSAARGVRLFCESGAPTNAGEEVLHLPVIVEAAESSPAAAASAAYQIRKFLSRDNYNRPHVQYNAIMLIRILADNPGPTFTRNIDEKFRDTVKWLLRQSRDPSVQQIMRETLSGLEAEKAYDENLAPLFALWRKERGLWIPPQQSRPGQPQQQRTRYAGVPSGPPRMVSPYDSKPLPQLPPPDELASRIEEGRTSANLLMQLTQTTPTAEILSNDLIREFADRCQGAHRDLQGYMNSTNPVPDEDTFQTLIETCERLSIASSRHQRAILAARKEVGHGFNATAFASPPQSPPGAAVQSFAPLANYAGSGPSTYAPLAGLSGKATLPYASVADLSPGVPAPSPALRRQLSEHEDNGTPAAASLYPSHPPAMNGTAANPFLDEKADPDPFSDEKEAIIPFSEEKEVYSSLATRPAPIPPTLTYTQRKAPQVNTYTSLIRRQPPPPIPTSPPQPQNRSTDHDLYGHLNSTSSSDDNLYSPVSPVAATSSSNPNYNFQASQPATPEDGWSASKHHWSSVSASTRTAPTHPPSQPLSPLLPSSRFGTGVGAGAAGSDATARARRGLQPSSPSYVRRQDVAAQDLTMIGGASPPLSSLQQQLQRPPPLTSWGEESFVHGSGRVGDDDPIR